MTDLDVLMIVPFQPNPDMFFLNGETRTSWAPMSLVNQAVAEFEDYLGVPLVDFEMRMLKPPGIGEPIRPAPQRSLTAVSLATHLERAGLTWRMFDPGIQHIGYWRKLLRTLRAARPRVVAVSSTFIQTSEWLHGLVNVVRAGIPDAKLILGGYYYSSNSQEFLTADADVLCVGEGEVRLPDIVKAIRDGRSLDRIPGLYVRQPNGALLHTGRAEPLDLEQVPPADWSLASRIEPNRVDLEKERMYYPVETQRGCVFKCEFCTYRTLSVPKDMSPEAAAEAIMANAHYPRGQIRVLDSTATFPHERWRRIMEVLIEKGGSPHPIWAFARVSDINDESASFMSRAGVRTVFIGQESGDERMLHLMRKGTHVSHIRPAMTALAQNGMNAQMSFIHGFPGENDESLRNTRALIASLNDGYERTPPALIYSVSPFFSQDFAGAGGSGNDSYVASDAKHLGTKRALEEILATQIAISKVPHAPALFVLHPGYVRGEDTFLSTYMTSPHRYELFRFAKQLQRGVHIFLERLADGTPMQDGELKKVKEQVMSQMPKARIGAGFVNRPQAWLKKQLATRLSKELRSEAEHGVGTCTRMLLGAFTLRDTGKLSMAYGAWKKGEYPRAVGRASTPQVEELAQELIVDAKNVPARWKAERKKKLAVLQASRAGE
jgi:anaerobic magnesium-protoporphyrin IX monomethyl ester cyclase